MYREILLSLIQIHFMTPQDHILAFCLSNPLINPLQIAEQFLRLFHPLGYKSPNLDDFYASPSIGSSLRTKDLLSRNRSLSCCSRMVSYTQTFLQWAGFADAIDESIIAITLFVSLLCVCLIFGQLVQESKWLNDSIIALVLGCATGALLLWNSGGTSSHILRFNEEVFFNYLLPPIIFNAGFQMKKKQFFYNFVPIILYGVIGVFVSFCIISAGCRWMFPKLGLTMLRAKDYLAIGTIFSATDSVSILQVLHPHEHALLYSLVFGEGVLNDATSVVFYRAIQKFEANHFAGLRVFLEILRLMGLSTILGITVGLLSAYLIKALRFGKHSSNREISLTVLMAYLSYMSAELFYLSGILTVFFCGIVMSHYTFHNMAESSRITTKHTFATMSFICETFILLYVGMDILDTEMWQMTDASIFESLGVLSTLMCTIIIGRAAFVFPLSALSNYFRGPARPKITITHQIIIWWSGLIRGAVSVALTFNQFTIYGRTKDPEYATMLISTVVIVLLTTVVFGIANKPLTQWLFPKSMTLIPNDMLEPHSPKDATRTDLQVPLLTNADHEHSVHNGITTRTSLFPSVGAPHCTIHHLWYTFDDACMRPIFGGQGYMHI
ncbi:hypothetical protein KP509_09G061100 [Ceratopteris richardii]|uniref:Cation/H+ exchanger transmembrane domain-containing protein n=1 Tax=Ceratopteris richardii TaxID=49495 RepID=A0A8T2U7V3_CERRI|nr:hypothetical protein KP509_09G061100 [Ceratopteris richardii]